MKKIQDFRNLGILDSDESGRARRFWIQEFQIEMKSKKNHQDSGIWEFRIQMKRKRAGWLASYEKLKPMIDAKTESFIQFLAELALNLSRHKDHKMEICVDQICC
jgi:hypothetical protein